MTDDERSDFIDPARTVCLCDVGSVDYVAAAAIGPCGEERLVLARRDAIGDENVRYDPTCSTTAPHERVGALPDEFVRRLTISRRAHRCGRRTCKGLPCRMRV